MGIQSALPKLLLTNRRIGGMTEVVHCKRNDYDVYIGRPSKWGNPFIIGRDGTRERVIEKYEIYLKGRPSLLKQVHTLKGKRLGCWCSPAPCHGDILKKYADNPELVREILEISDDTDIQSRG